MDNRVMHGRKYQTRCGYPITRMIYHKAQDVEDGFPWKIYFSLPDDREDHAWYNAIGRWTNNPFMKTDLDLMLA